MVINVSWGDLEGCGFSPRNRQCFLGLRGIMLWLGWTLKVVCLLRVAHAMSTVGVQAVTNVRLLRDASQDVEH